MRLGLLLFCLLLFFVVLASARPRSRRSYSNRDSRGHSRSSSHSRSRSYRSHDSNRHGSSSSRHHPSSIQSPPASSRSSAPTPEDIVNGIRSNLKSGNDRQLTRQNDPGANVTRSLNATKRTDTEPAPTTTTNSSRTSPGCYLVDRATKTCGHTDEEILNRMKPCKDQALLSRIANRGVRVCRYVRGSWSKVTLATVRLSPVDRKFELKFKSSKNKMSERKSVQKASSKNSSRKASSKSSNKISKLSYRKSSKKLLDAPLIPPNGVTSNEKKIASKIEAVAPVLNPASKVEALKRSIGESLFNPRPAISTSESKSLKISVLAKPLSAVDRLKLMLQQKLDAGKEESERKETRKTEEETEDLSNLGYVDRMKIFFAQNIFGTSDVRTNTVDTASIPEAEATTEFVPLPDRNMGEVESVLDKIKSLFAFKIFQIGNDEGEGSNGADSRQAGLSMVDQAMNSLKSFYDTLREKVFGRDDSQNAKEEDLEIRDIMRSMGYDEQVLDDNFGRSESRTKKTGIEETQNEKSENEEAQNIESGNEEVQNEESGNEEVQNEESGNEEVQNEQSGNEEPEFSETQNKESGNEKSQNEDSEIEESTIEETQNAETRVGSTANDEMVNKQNLRDVPNLLGILKSLGLAGGNVAIMKTGNGNLDDKLDDNIGTDLEEFVVEATDDEGGGDQEKEGIEQLDQEQDDDGEDVVDEERDEVVDEEEVEGDEESEEVSDEADDHDLEKEEQPVAEEQGGVDAEVENESNDATPKDLEDEEDDGNQSEASDIAPNDTDDLPGRALPEDAGIRSSEDNADSELGYDDDDDAGQDDGQDADTDDVNDERTDSDDPVPVHPEVVGPEETTDEMGETGNGNGKQEMAVDPLQLMQTEMEKALKHLLAF